MTFLINSTGNSKKKETEIVEKSAKKIFQTQMYGVLQNSFSLCEVALSSSFVPSFVLRPESETHFEFRWKI